MCLQSTPAEKELQRHLQGKNWRTAKKTHGPHLFGILGPIYTAITPCAFFFSIPACLSRQKSRKLCSMAPKTNTLFLTAVALLSGAAIFLLQSKSVNLRPGHNGWVSSQFLSVADKASWENGLLGYSCACNNNAEQDFGTKIYGCGSKGEGYYYFDRNPVFFLALSNLLIDIPKDLGDKIFLSKQWMNAIYLLIFAAVWFLAYLYRPDPSNALALTLILASGYRFLAFKDMFNFDPPAAVGLIGFFIALKLYEAGKIKPLYVVLTASLACLMGHGLITCVAVLLWFLIDAAGVFRKTSFALRGLFSRTSFLSLLSVTILFASSLSYNIVTEAAKQNIRLAETSIVDSITRRTQLSIYKKAGHEYASPRGFARTNAKRMVSSVVPVGLYKWLKKHHESLTLMIITIALAFLTLAFFFPRKIPPIFKILKSEIGSRRYWVPSTLVVLLSAFCWSLIMRGYILFHEFAHIYHLGFYVVLGTFLLATVTRTWKKNALLLAAFVVFIHSLYETKKVGDVWEENTPDYVGDFTTIRRELDNLDLPAVAIHSLHEELVNTTPHAHCFYIGERFIDQDSPYVIAFLRELEGYTNLTPDNGYYGLFEKDETLEEK